MQDEFPNTSSPTRGTSAQANEQITVIALFDSLQDAESAVDDLLAEGFERSRMSVVASNAAGEYDSYADDTTRDGAVDDDSMGPGEGAAAGGGIGAAIGGVGGVLMGLGLLAIPGIGPALAAGPLISGLIGAGIGGAAGSITGALVNSGVDEERAGHYAEGVRRGGTLLSVETTASRTSVAEDVMVRNGSVDIEERVDRWRAGGWSRFDERAEPFTAEEIEEERTRSGVYTREGTARRR